MKFVKTKTLNQDQKICANELWNNEYPKNLQYDRIIEFEEYLDNLDDQHHKID